MVVTATQGAIAQNGPETTCESTVWYYAIMEGIITLCAIEGRVLVQSISISISIRLEYAEGIPPVPLLGKSGIKCVEADCCWTPGRDAPLLWRGT